MHPRQAATGEHFVGLAGEGLVAEEEGLHGGVLDGWVFKVKHIDVSIPVIVISVKQFDSIFPSSHPVTTHGLLRTHRPPEKLLDP
ncbi:hypothetical protein TUM18999_23080 [Pseudomonas tohonis]|uniref:Uncharacterized protein n=1 Tax=Pseudomonas tohonis TaxID=2725477 RepID=A0A6J4E300_9PSED|nr:hypothetical protein TUM18999_23080 [Pseudomonas tohonis]GJN55652.1 hypothetical protein TUM20286_54040 [Pseudomonas tohonis]